MASLELGAGACSFHVAVFHSCSSFSIFAFFCRGERACYGRVIYVRVISLSGGSSVGPAILCFFISRFYYISTVFLQRQSFRLMCEWLLLLLL